MAAANPIGARSKNACRWKKKSSKVVEAEMCNKVEARHLVLITRILDREKAHHEFGVEKEKRAVKSAMQAMKETSGESELGEMPSGPDDTDYRDSPYFLNGVGVISEKRLQKWRIMADQMQRELKADVDSGLLEPAWRTNPYENIEQSFLQLLDRLGYEEEAALVNYLKKHERRSFVTPRRRKSSAAAAGIRTRCDVFACLRNGGGCGDRLSGDGTSQEREFCVQQWERVASREYIAAVTRHLSSGTDWPQSPGPAATLSDASSASDVRLLAKDSDIADMVPRGEDNGCDSAWTTAVTYARGDRRENPTSTSHSGKPRSARRYRFTTTSCSADGATENSIDARPTLPTVIPLVGTNDSNDRRTGTTKVSESTADDVYNTHARNDSRRKLGERTRITTKLENCRPRTAPHGICGKNSGKTRKCRSATTCLAGNAASEQVGNVTGSDERETHHKHNCIRWGIGTNAMNFSQTTLPTPPTPPTTTATSELDTSVHWERSVAKETASDVGNWISEAIVEVATPSTSDNGSSHHKSAVLSSSSSSSSYSSSSRSSSASNVNVPPTSQTIQASLGSRPKSQTARWNLENPGSNAVSPSPPMDEVLPVRVPGDGLRRLPQWKRDLMLEAPPGIFSSREPIKVSVVMSKSQRQRELDQLVEENLSDVRMLVMRERARKMRARMNVFITMGTIQHAVEALRHTVDRE